MTLALASEGKGEVTLVFSGRGSRRVRPVAELASWGEESPAAMDEFERRSAEVLRMLASELAARRSASRPIFGVTVALQAPDPALGRSPSPGVVVTAVDPGSPAEKMGLARGDVIVSVNGLDLGEGRLAVERLSQAVRSAGSGGAVSVAVTRGKGAAVVTGKLAEY
jgi:S1-C subfamily serine protease